MNLKMTVLTMSVLSAIVSANAQADETLSLTHSLTSYTRNNGKTELTFIITATNNSPYTLNNVTLEPAGNDFIGNPEKISISLPALAPGSAVSVNWQAVSYMDRSYFLQSPVIFFNALAHRQNLTSVAFSLPSETK